VAENWVCFGFVFSYPLSVFFFIILCKYRICINFTLWEIGFVLQKTRKMIEGSPKGFPLRFKKIRNPNIEILRRTPDGGNKIKLPKCEIKNDGNKLTASALF
jgi:hypothetical protein